MREKTVLSIHRCNNGGDSPANDSTVVAGDYYLESSEVLLVSCDDVIPGCMDETAFNYNPEARTDGNCEAVACVVWMSRH